MSTVGGNTPTSIDNAPAGQLIPQRLRLIEGGSVGARLDCRVSWVPIPPRAALLRSKKVVLGVVDLFTLPCLAISSS